MSDTENAPIRVLHVVGRMDRGGIETMIMNLYRAIDRDKVQFDFLTHYGREAEYNEEIRSMGGRIFNMPALKDGNKVYFSRFFVYGKELKKFFSEHKEISVIHGHLTQLASIYMPIAKKYGNVSCCIAHGHNTKSIAGLVSIVTRFMHWPLQYCADELFSCSAEAARWIIPKHSKRIGEVKILRNAIDSEKFNFNEEIRGEVRQELDLDGCEALACVARFEDVKNHAFLVSLFYEYKKTRPKSKLLLIGDGPLREGVERQVEQLALVGDVRFLGVRGDVGRLLQGVDVVVMPSKYEGLPVSLIEAQTAGLPCVVSDGVSREVDITGNCQFISLDSPMEEWCQAIHAALQNVRTEGKEAIVESGYDTTETAREMQRFYLEKAK